VRFSLDRERQPFWAFLLFDLALGVASAEGLAGLHEELLAFKILLAQLKKKYFAN
jgi:hypothetical protein